MTERALGWWVMASVLVHTAGLSALSVVRPSFEHAAPTVVAIEVVSPPAPPPAMPPPVVSQPPRAPAGTVERVPTPPASRPEPPAETPNLLDTPAVPAPAIATPPRVDGALVPLPTPSAPAPVLGGPAGTGRLFASGDLLVPPGSDTEGGSGAAGARGSGAAAAGAASSNVAASGTGLTALARPLGGYQIKPEYPDSARRARAQGVALLRFEVLATGRVGSVVVARSAGHHDLDRAAVEAIRQWQFEPARRGATPVAVWVTLPVRFELTDR